MKTEQIQHFLMRYFEAEQCDIIEKHPAYVTVKLSPSADKDLTNRPYYWSFVERTGAPAETVTYTFMLDPEKAREALPKAPPGPAQPWQAQVDVPQPAGGQPAGEPDPGPGREPAGPAAGDAAPRGAGTGSAADGGADSAGSGGPPAAGAAVSPGTAGGTDSILGRYFGYVPTTVATRIPRDDVTYGSRRLEQIFGAVRAKGKYVRLFEEPPQGHRMAPASFAYDTWFHANYKVELACDLKRNEIHSLAIRLTTGEIVENFYDRLTEKKLTPRLPANIHIIPDKMSLAHGAGVLERFLENKLKPYDHAWAEEAHDRLLEELARIRVYYESLIKAADEDKKPDFETHYRRRQAEIEWQYRPRVQVSVINCGLFHLRPGESTRN